MYSLLYHCETVNDDTLLRLNSTLLYPSARHSTLTVPNNDWQYLTMPLLYPVSLYYTTTSHSNTLYHCTKLYPYDTIQCLTITATSLYYALLYPHDTIQCVPYFTKPLQYLISLHRCFVSLYHASLCRYSTALRCTKLYLAVTPLYFTLLRVTSPLLNVPHKALPLHYQTSLTLQHRYIASIYRTKP